MSKLWKVLTVLGLAVGVLTVPASEAAAAPGWHEGRCTAADAAAVTVVVDFQQLGGAPQIRCAFGLPAEARGSAALQAAQFPVSGIGTDNVNPAFICRLSGRPRADEVIPVEGNPGYTETCRNTPPASAYWSYWWAAPGAGWTYSSLGVQSNRVNFGGYEGWSFSLNASEQTNPPPRFDPVPVAGTFRSITPSRLLDTRTTGAPIAPGGVRDLTVAGVGGVPASASAVQLNLTAVQATAFGYLSVWPAGRAETTTSAVNFRPGGAEVANAAIVGVGSNGRIRIASSPNSSVHVIADVTGYVVGGTAQEPGTYVPVTPTRVGDTRESGGSVAAKSARAFPIAGMAGVPRTVGAVAVNIIAINPKAAGFLSIVRTPQENPSTSFLNTSVAISAIANSTVAALDEQGRILVFNGAPGAVDVAIDVVGYYRAGTPTAVGAFQLIQPRRAFDTRNSAAVAPNSVLSVDTRAAGGPGSTPGSSALLNVAAVQPQANGYLTVQPGGVPTSTLNFRTNEVIPNAAVAPVATRVLNGSNGRTHVLVDVLGYYLG